MAVPRQRKTKSRRNQHRMHFFTKKPSITVCLKCGKPVLPHTVCQNCGYYKEKEIINVLEKLTKKERKKREKEMASKEKTEGGGEKTKPLTIEELSKK